MTISNDFTNNQSINTAKADSELTLTTIMPAHPLGHFAINTIQRQSLHPEDVVAKMGYPTSQYAKASARLRYVLISPTLGLKASHFDFKYSRDEFIVALFTALDIDSKHYQPALQTLQDKAAQKPSTISYALRAEIDFPSASRSKNTQWALSKFKQLPLPKNFVYISEEEQAMIIQNRIVEHYQRYQSNLPGDGIIRSYYLICEVDDERQRTDFELPIA
jgi:hypothetical protein